MNDVFMVTTPQLGVNDSTATLVEWCVPDGGRITIGECLCVLETAKVVFDVPAEVSGYVAHLAKIGEELPISAALALIGPDWMRLIQERDTRHVPVPTHLVAPVQATAKAQAMAERLGVDLSDIDMAGIVREQDVWDYHERIGQPEVPLPKWEPDPSRPLLAIYGAGKGATTIKECLDLGGGYQVVCFLDDNPHHATTHCGLPVIAGSWLEELRSRGIQAVVAGFAASEGRLRLKARCDGLGILLANVVHPRAYVSPTARMGQGNYVKAGAVIETGVTLGHCCIIDNGAVIAHDTVIEDGCHLAPGAVLGSSIRVGAFTIIGIGASVATGVTIGRGAVISLGTSVTKDVPDRAVIEGVPGRIIGTRRMAGPSDAL